MDNCCRLRSIHQYVACQQRQQQQDACGRITGSNGISVLTRDQMQVDKGKGNLITTLK